MDFENFKKELRQKYSKIAFLSWQGTKELDETSKDYLATEISDVIHLIHTSPLSYKLKKEFLRSMNPSLYKLASEKLYHFLN